MYLSPYAYIKVATTSSECPRPTTPLQISDTETASITPPIPSPIAFLNPHQSPNSKAPSKEKMAAFSSIQQHPSFLLDSDIDPHNSLFPQFYEHQAAFQNLDHSTQVTVISNNEASVLSVTNRNSMDSSSIVTHFFNKHDHDGDHNYYSEHLALKPINPIGRKRKCKQASSSNSAQSKDMREMKGKKEKKVKNSEAKKKDKKNEKKEAEEAPAGYIHVRARRGQATDSHSLAERVRRERISERMKLLQTLVPGCEKVTGKALMLDEIINYVQSLQNQVEFLSMKLASLNPMFYDFGMDLESFMIRPDQNLSSLPSPLPNVQQCNPTTLHNYPILDNNSVNSLMFQQPQFPNPLPHEGDRSEVPMEVDDPRPNIMNGQSAGFSYSLFSYH